MEENFKNCPKCGGDNALSATKCKHCGEYFEYDEKMETGKPINHIKVSGITLLVCVIAFILSAITGMNNYEVESACGYVVLLSLIIGILALIWFIGAIIVKVKGAPTSNTVKKESAEVVNDTVENTTLKEGTTSNYDVNLESSHDTWYKSFVLRTIDDGIEKVSILACLLIICTAFPFLKDEDTFGFAIAGIIIGISIVFGCSWLFFCIIETRNLLRRIEYNTRKENKE